ncbi:MAG TPA: hypothetical protein VN256_05880 [Pyrinomonadaceae bacterium]|nr:hypothetical protein [Pyrinomonadaceae bacterium]
MGRRVIVWVLLLTVAASAGFILSKGPGGTKVAVEERFVKPEGDTPAGSVAMGPHMRMTAARPPRPEDEARADSLAKEAREAIEKYKDYRVALGDGYKILRPDVPQEMYHFNNERYFDEAARRFAPEHPPSLLYEKKRRGYELIGVMYTAPAGATEDELNERAPLSVASWHLHVNVCLPQDDPLEKLFEQGSRFGLNGSITTREECDRAGGRFHPQFFGWMVHLYPYERTRREMWSLERQMFPGHHHPQ